MNSRVARWLATLRPPKAPGTIHCGSNPVRTTTTTINAQLNRSQSLFFARSSSNISPKELEGHDNQAGVVPQDETLQGAVTSTVHSEVTQHAALSLVPIPSLPPPVIGYPTPWIDREDYSQYLFPLYSCGWGVSFMPKRKVQEGVMADRDVVNTPPDYKPPRTPHLVGLYKFDNYNSAVDFFNDIVKFANSENHHPRILTLENSKTPSVLIATQTDSAIRPAWGQPKSRRVRGITRRDLRLAWLVETLLRDKFDDAMDMRSVWPSDQQPSWDLLLQRLQGTVLVEASPTPQANNINN